MLIEIEHTTRFRFSAPVFLEPHLLRLRPRADGAQAVESFEIEIRPGPAGLCDVADYEGNPAHRCWFDGTTRELAIRAHSRVRTLRSNPFDFLLDSGNLRLPLPYTPAERAALAPCLAQARLHSDVEALAGEILDDSGSATLAFLGGLNKRLFETFDKIHREDGEPHAPEETLRQGEGACRDLAVLFLSVCRHSGIAGRFVCGYFAIPEEDEQPALHAWAEVYLPGAGWRGYDPTHGLAVAERHVVLAAAALPSEAAPVRGTFRGTGVTAEMAATVAIKTPELTVLPRAGEPAAPGTCPPTHG